PGGAVAGRHPQRGPPLEELAPLVRLSRPRPAGITHNAYIARHRFAPPPPLAGGYGSSSGGRRATSARDGTKVVSAASLSPAVIRQT
ncbi:MAG: hypothetical protein ACXW13_09965, partial [Burkholderiaceae bacterium]